MDRIGEIRGIPVFTGDIYSVYVQEECVGDQKKQLIDSEL